MYHMYKIYIDKDIKSETYKKFIDFSVSRSDAFMIVIYRYLGEIEKMFTPPDKSLFDNEELYISVLKSIERAKKEKYEDTKAFIDNTEPFLRKLEPYLIKKRVNPTEWADIRLDINEHMRTEVCIYRICSEVKNCLLQPNALFEWKYPYFPDDLCFMKKGFCWFYSVAHEEYAYMYVDNDNDIEFLKELRLDFKVNKLMDNDMSIYYEDYALSK